MPELNIPSWPFNKVISEFLHPNSVKVQWFIDPRFKEAHPWKFQAQINYDGDPDHWINLGQEVQDVFYQQFEIDPPKIKGKRPQIRVQLIAEDSYNSNPAIELPPKLALYVQGILRRLKLQRTFMPTLRGVLFHRKISGQPCPKCSEKLTNRSTQSNCNICYGTSFVGGFWKSDRPNVILVAEEQSLSQVSNLGHIDPSKRKAIFIGLPQPSVGDIWVDDKTLKRYRIRAVNIAASVFDFPIVIQVEMGLIPFGDIIYELN